VAENPQEEAEWSEKVEEEQKVSGNHQEGVELSEYLQEEEEVSQNHQEEVEERESESTPPQPQRNAVTGFRAPLKVSCFQYLILFNKKIDCGICM
jgi:hypothetical protein